MLGIDYGNTNCSVAVMRSAGIGVVVLRVISSFLSALALRLFDRHVERLGRPKKPKGSRPPRHEAPETASV